MSQSKGYVDSDYLQLLAKMVAQYKQRTYELMHIEPGYTVLDVGCGPGLDTIPLAQLVGDTGQVVGVDFDEAMIAEADHGAMAAGVSARVVHRHADATALPFEPDTFDASRSERLFQHLPHPELALSEMVRVTRPGGWVVVLDTDFGTLSIDTPEVEIEQRLRSYRLAHHIHNAFSGRQLYRLFKQQGLIELVVEICPIYVTDYAVARQSGNLDEVEEGALAAEKVTKEELRRWRTSLEQADAQGVFFGSVTQTLVAGRKP